MKKTLSFVLCVSLLLSACSFMAIQTTALDSIPVTGLSYEFNQDGNLQGWEIAQKIEGMTVQGGMMKGTYHITSGEYMDPRIQSPASLQLDPQYCLLKIRLRNTSGASWGKFFITRNTDGTEIGDNGIRSLNIPILPNSDFVEYTYDLSGWEHWTGTVYRVWFDVASAFSGSFDYDYIRFVKKGSNSVTYNKNAGTDIVTNMPENDAHAAAGGGYLLSAQIPVREGYDFLGWSKTASGSEFVLNNTLDLTGNTALYAVWNRTDAFYTVEGEYAAGEYAVKLYYSAEKPTNLASFGFAANPEKMTFDRISYESGFVSAQEDGIGTYKNENGVFVDQWYPAAGYINPADKRLIATLVYDMTPQQYAVFDPAADFVPYHYSDLPVSALWSGLKYLYAPHAASIEVRYEMIDTNPLDDLHSVMISAAIDGTRGTVSFANNSRISTLENYTFTVAPNQGQIIKSVAFSAGGGLPAVLTPQNGIYTIPASSLTGNVTVEVVLATLITRIELSSIEAPVAGALPDDNAVISNGGGTYDFVGANPISWWDGATKLTGAFGGDTAYTVRVHLTPSALSEFSAAAECTIDGNAASIAVNADGSAYITYTYPATGPAYVPGDANDDGIVNMQDLLLLLKYLSGWPVEVNLDASDVDNNQAVNMSDLVLLLKYLSGWEVTIS